MTNDSSRDPGHDETVSVAHDETVSAAHDETVSAVSAISTDDTLAASEEAPPRSTEVPTRSASPRDSGPAATEPADRFDLPVKDPERYASRREIARGGMGRIVCARDRELGRDIAIKELLASNPTLERRFEREVRLTARLQHPAIISVHAAGRWPDGRAFYTMKLVDGRPLDRAIAEAGSLTARLALLPHVIAVAEAIAYAHSQGVVHRDLKPANVLVGAFGETVVIDWGLAKEVGSTSDALDHSSPSHSDPARNRELTSFGDAMGTPSYMPPEQARGEPADARSDVYSLGAMLYHLLAGKMPYAGRSSAGEIVDAVRAGPPTPLAERSAAAPPDLLAVVAKAMARDPEERYPTAAELAADLERFQTGQLVAAHQYSTWHLLARWVRRHRGVVAVSTAAAIALAAIAAVSVQRIRTQRDLAERQRQLVKENRDEVESMLDFMLGDLKGSLKPLGKLSLLALVAKRADEYYQTRPIDWGQPEDARRRALTLANLGEVFFHQGDLPAALRSFRESLAIREQLAALTRDTGEPGWQRDLAVAHSRLGDVLIAQGDLPAALTAIRSGLAISERLVAEDPDNPVWQRDLATSHERLGHVLLRQSDLPAALAEYRTSLEICERLAASDPSAQRRRDLAISQEKVGDALRASGDLAAALQAYHESMATNEALAASDPTRPEWQHALGVSQLKVATILYRQGDLAGALDGFRAGLPIRERLAASDPTNTEWQRDLSVSHERIGDVLLRQQDLAGALAAYRASTEIAERLAASDPSNSEWQRDRAVGHYTIGSVLQQQGEIAAARDAFRAGLAISERLAAGDPTNAQWQHDLIALNLRLGEVQVQQDDLPAALSTYRAALAAGEQLAAGAPGNPESQNSLAAIRELLGDVLLRQGDLAAALETYRVSLELAARLAATDPSSADWQFNLARRHSKLGDALRSARDLGAACASYRAGAAIIEALVAGHPGNPEHLEYQRKLAAATRECGARK